MPVIPKDQVGKALAQNQALIDGLAAAMAMVDDIKRLYAKPAGDNEEPSLHDDNSAAAQAAEWEDHKVQSIPLPTSSSHELWDK